MRSMRLLKNEIPIKLCGSRDLGTWKLTSTIGCPERGVAVEVIRYHLETFSLELLHEKFVTFVLLESQLGIGVDVGRH